MKTSRGFTLLEMAVVVSVIGITTVILAPALASFVSSRKLGNADNQALINQKIARALLDYAAENASLSLPERCSTGCSHAYAPVSSTIKVDVVPRTGLSDKEIDDDGSAGKNARVYQKVDLSQTLPIYFRSGPEVTLAYQYAVIYSTTSSTVDGAGWNTAGARAGNSTSMTAANYSIWQVSGTDFSPYYFSTLPLQKSMMQLTVNRIDRLRDALRDYVLAKQLQSTTTQINLYASLTSGTSPSPIPLNAGENDCKSDSGWYNLARDASGVVKTVGLVPEEYAKTAWGAPIHLCTNYIPAGTIGNDPPFYAALRINKSLSSASDPSAVESENVVFGF